MQAREYRRNYELERSYWWFVGVRAMVRELLSLAAGDGGLGRVLDVGCGTGALLDELHPRAEELWGVDVSTEALGFCAKRGCRNLICADAARSPFRSGHFDLITGIGIIEHLENDGAFLRELNRLLKPKGVMILLTSSFPFLWSAHDTANEHKRRYYLRSLERQIGRSGFETLSLSHLNFFLFPALAAALMVHRLVRGTEPERSRRLLPLPPRLVNTALTMILRAEARLMRRVRLPWGVSMIGAFRKTGPAVGGQQDGCGRLSGQACELLADV